ncbi:hypothetical protein ETD86_50440 [Nonomuraea turkmeniaca]|uniref:Acyltransferase n=1 Tax=Nonomuraea turkmeniaca TaxID=103838 RepID=A0A5S4FFT2_9ACTN|nr:hypothetical protein ETD86_50440 [Nonomuraea turkmeniaca]
MPQLLANLTMFQAVPDIANVDVVYWTLWVEMRFYLLILLLTWIGMTRARVMAGLWIWLGLAFAVQAGLVPGVADLVVQSEFAHYFIAGMALFLLYKFGLNPQIALLVPAGALTYPLYLLHAHIGFIVFARLGTAVDAHVLLCGLIVVMLGAAYVMHRFVERPLAPALKRLLSPRPAAPVLDVLVAGQPTR